LSGYHAQWRSEMSDYSPARAKALLELYGWRDRDGDGWRETPDGSPLVLEISTQADELQRQLDDQKRKSLGLIGIRSKLRIQQFAENLKAGRAGKLMVWSLASSANSPDGFGGLARVYGPQSGAQNFARFKLPAVDAIYQRMNELPDGPERLALFNEIVKLVVAYAPYKYHTHRIYVDLTQPWLIGYRRPLFWSEQWQFMDVDMTLRALKLD
jgi:ABC-type transport system substrate-binding protein